MNNNGISTTDLLHFAAYLDATRQVTFVECRRAGVGDKILFLFRDSLGQMDALYQEYISGAPCSAIDFSASLRHLRREMSAVETKIKNTEGALFPCQHQQMKPAMRSR